MSTAETLLSWSRRAACSEHPAPAGTTIWFSRHPEDQERAKAICSDCPVREECLHWAVKHRESGGIWGGLTEDERVALPYRYADCAACGKEFTFAASRGRPPVTCSDACAAKHRSAQVSRWYQENGDVERPGLYADLGHGLSRYRQGCRCRTCRRASREHRSSYARSA